MIWYNKKTKFYYVFSKSKPIYPYENCLKTIYALHFEPYYKAIS